MYIYSNILSIVSRQPIYQPWTWNAEAHELCLRREHDDHEHDEHGHDGDGVPVLPASFFVVVMARSEPQTNMIRAW